MKKMVTGRLWRIRLFGGPILESSLGNGTIQTHFRSAKVASLLAYLALHHNKPCSREALIEALWPEEGDSTTLANRLRVTLASLRRQLEPQGYPFGSVLDTSVTGCVRLSGETTSCDYVEFDAAYRAKDFFGAAKLMTGPLLPGIYDEWAITEQVRVELLREELAPFSTIESNPTEEYREATKLHRLPLFLTTFLSRESELAQLGESIERHRLVTVTGPAGVGKTRVSVEVGRRSDRPTVFVPLSDCSDLDSLCESVMRSIAVMTHSGIDPLAQVLESLAHMGPLRLLLDNAEHMIDTVAEFVESALEAAPELSIVASSRQALEIAGEHIFRLEPFPVPSEEIRLTQATIESFPSTMLFVDRVRQSRPDFVVRESNLPYIAKICQRLEGLPLAIELAAAQITIHSVAEILSHLDSSLVDLQSRRRSLPARHRSLRAAIQSSLDGLHPSTAAFLSQLSVFWGGWTAQAARAVTGDEMAIDKLEDLTLRSLVQATASDGPTRFTCLEMVRQMMEDFLPREDFRRLQLRHRDYFYSLATAVTEDDILTLVPLDAEYHNLAAAFLSTDVEEPIFWRANTGAIMHAFIRGQHRAALKWIREFRSALDSCHDPIVRRDWCNASLQVLADLGLFAEANDLLTTMRSTATVHSDWIGVTQTVIVEGLLTARQGDTPGAIRLHRLALADARRLGDQSLLESGLSHLSGSLHEIARMEDVPQETRWKSLEESESLALQLIQLVGSHSRRLPLAHLLAGVATFYQDRFPEAEAHFAHATEAAERLGIRTVTMYASYFEAEIASRRTNAVEAEAKRARYRELQTQIGIFVGNESRW